MLTPSGWRISPWVRRIIARLFGPRIVEPEIRMAAAKVGISMDKYGRCSVPSDAERGITRGNH
jgi:hypothetical protein